MATKINKRFEISMDVYVEKNFFSDIPRSKPVY